MAEDESIDWTEPLNGLNTHELKRRRDDVKKQVLSWQTSLEKIKGQQPMEEPRGITLYELEEQFNRGVLYRERVQIELNRLKNERKTNIALFISFLSLFGSAIIPLILHYLPSSSDSVVHEICILKENREE